MSVGGDLSSVNARSFAGVGDGGQGALGFLLRSCGWSRLGVLIKGGLGGGRGSCEWGSDRGVPQPLRDKFGGSTLSVHPGCPVASSSALSIPFYMDRVIEFNCGKIL